MDEAYADVVRILDKKVTSKYADGHVQLWSAEYGPEPKKAKKVRRATATAAAAAQRTKLGLEREDLGRLKGMYPLSFKVRHTHSIAYCWCRAKLSGLVAFFANILRVHVLQGACWSGPR